jgi:acetyl esterase/lipase
MRCLSLSGVVSVALSVLGLCGRASADEPILLWPGLAPGEKADGAATVDPPREGDSTIRVTNVTQPEITVYRPAAEKDTGAAVVICPGGGYARLAYNKEGTEVAEWLNTIGVTGVVLKYRCPVRNGRSRHEAPLQDVQRALGIVRSRASEWKLDSKRIGVLGFSAGGHLAACASNNFDKRTYDRIDAADDVSCRPDFAVLIYPAYLVDKQNVLSPELPVSSNTPPTFIAMTEDDGVRVECGLFYYFFLKQAGVKAEMHLYPVGGHGYGLRPSANTVSTWPARVADWMNASGLLAK